jgi:ferric-dicitrate binding protein FerR (iron transport regulator)
MGKSERNAMFFDQVIHDFNEINNSSSSRSRHHKWYWAAASILIIFSFSLWFVKPFESETLLQNFTLPDGSEVTLSAQSTFEYDSISFESTKWIKIQGTAEIMTKAEEHLLIETPSGYLLLDENSSLQIQELKDNEMRVFVEKGNIRWLNPAATSEELAFVGGERMHFKNDGKTVLLNHDPKSQKSFLIFDNYMNL